MKRIFMIIYLLFSTFLHICIDAQNTQIAENSLEESNAKDIILSNFEEWYGRI